jgi:small-conductance mechanosensitive channel
MDSGFFTQNRGVFTDMIYAVLIILLTTFILYIVKKFLERIINRINVKEYSKLFFLTQILKRINLPFFVVVGFFITSKVIEMKSELDILSSVLLTLFLGFHLIYVANYILTRALLLVLSQDNTGDDADIQDDETVIRFISFIFKGLMWVFLLIMILQHVGYNVSALLGGLGIVGLAIAFAVQNILEDIFSFLSIYFDKPFRVGDFIVISGDSGIIQRIGIKTTRIKTLEGQELVISNKELTSIRINNYKKMDRRRVSFSFGVEYATTNEQLKKINDIVCSIFDKLDIVDLDRVHFKGFGDFALIYEVVYYVNSPDYKVYMDVQQKINFDIKESFEKESIEMAFPTQKIILEKS